MQLTLIVPELIWPEPGDAEAFDDAVCPALRTLLGRSRLSRRQPQSFEATLCDVFGQTDATPYAALRRLGESAVTGDAESMDGYWSCSDPVHLRYHEELLILADSSSLDIAPDDAQALIDALNAHFPELGRFHLATPERWYLQTTDSSVLDTTGVAPLSNMAGRSLDHERPVTAAQKALYRLLAEIQMLLHTHPVNQKREAAGQMPINSLWLWGGGVLPPRRECNFDGVWSNNALALGLARASGVMTHTTARDAAVLLENMAPDTHHCLVFEDLLAPVQYEKRDAYRNALAGLEARWFAPLLAALRSGRVRQLHMESSTAYATLRWDSTRNDQWAFWRRPRSLAATAQELVKHKT